MRRAVLVSVAAIQAAVLAGVLVRAQGPEGSPARERREKLSLQLRATPAISFSPARVFAVAELRGDPPPDAAERLYCAAVEWDWGDGTRSENAYDCEPYEEGRSEIRRRFAAEHLYTMAGRFRISIRLKREGRVVLASNTTVQVRPGVRDWGLD
jgi:hypothetical protein